jgi:signal transduction histidine kinase
MSVRRRAVDEAMLALESLADKLGRRMENAALAERLLRAEKLAGLGLMAGGVGHALNNPLTAVLGFAELIADTSDEVRVKADAGMIVREALRMRQTVDLLRDFRRPEVREDELIELQELVRAMGEECRERLEKRGGELVVRTESGVPAICGSRGRLRQMLEHLLNNAAQAVASAGAGREQAIRVVVSCDGSFVHMVVSDTGPGFSEPGRVFDPFYTTRRPGEGAGLGLNICYGIVREHGGEISAFNLHPSGAAVAVELPVAKIATEKNEGAAESVLQVVND